ncbi:MAG: peptidoglycan DD-metalloendopeptidase family protein [Actinomycetales bacterium]|nr:peptidoglycan DD-metalloendopeptidase family protein [Actinomycetales bacterium]
MTVLAAAALLLTVWAAVGGPAEPVPEGSGRWPVMTPVVLSGFRPPDAPWGAGHRGVDLAARTGETVRAVLAGRIAFAGTVAGKPVVTIALADGRRITYEPVRASVRVGDRVTAGDVLGVLSSSGGHCGGVVGCLHLGLVTASGYADPMSLLGRRPAVLKPWPP